ncbi:MAG: CvpA family protein [Quisquiliibacterium sp.]
MDSSVASSLQLSSLTLWDWFVLILTLLSVMLGAYRGMVRTVFGLAAWAVALLGTPMAGPAAAQLTGMQQQPWVVFVVLFLVLFLVIRLSGVLVAKALGKIGLGGLDRVLGAVLGFARALVLVAVVVVVARLFDMHKAPEWRNSVCRPLLDTIAQLTEPYMRAKAPANRKS